MGGMGGPPMGGMTRPSMGGVLCMIDTYFTFLE